MSFQLQRIVGDLSYRIADIKLILIDVNGGEMFRKKVKNLNHVPDRKIYRCGIKYRLFRILSIKVICETMFWEKIARRAWYLTRKLCRGWRSWQLRQLFSRFANFAEVTNFEAELQVSDDQSEAGSQLVEKKWGIGLLSDNR
ncbi:hypothetical protein BDP27DRAFT_1365589 [Rhodocollybia butyracea]|uniref:Uncharacterized protein n=1 Tax=Rhodocollybia butyracea TaxID=206335 RepID=A0A9P5PNL3_9AGAR|nr:hypothetical protein BDP27DRAFT_1365589 [Rhodocollybia butyracea]